ncbi:MAG TPA: transposase [Thermomicrobiales bacterium]|nr:transposase [Thermomicrobiales bacterium]
MEHNRQRQASAAVQAPIATHIAVLAQERRQLDRHLFAMSAAHPRWRLQDGLLPSGPRVGPGRSHTLLAALPERGSLARQAMAALVGVALLNCDSSTRAGRRRGRPKVRTALSKAALTATRGTPVMATTSPRFRAAGKPPKVALTAGMRNLLAMLNAMLPHQTAGDPSFASQT